MRLNLQITYWCLVSITIISSCFLFLVVASETNARNVGAAARGDSAAAATATATATATANPNAAAANNRMEAAIGNRREGDTRDANKLNAERVNDFKFIKMKKEYSASGIEGGFVRSLSNVRVQVAPTGDVDGHSDLNDGSKGEDVVPSPGEFVSEQENEQISDDVSDSSVPISEGGALQLEAPQVRVLLPEVGIKNADDLGSEDIDTMANAFVQSAKGGKSTDAPGLPDISSENPTVITLNEITSTDLPLAGGLEQHTLDPVIISKVESSSTNHTKDGDDATKTTEDDQKDDQIEKINDSGGATIPPQPPDGDDATDTTGTHIPSTMSAKTSSNATTTPEMNLTVEEVPIPVFSEWAQKQMEAAEKQQLEQVVVNSSTQKKNLTTGSKQPPGKLRTKNYASPDCGAKIIASNADAQNTGAVLTSSKDEYMLSPCTNRIWFVVELCEAIQAETIDLANFELFSSSPKNFTVAVSNRFPTRDWSNVGRFIAEDKRTVQSFELHPHLFGKFVRADIHSHYNSEHFCPVSLFRVYGTSEFEAFETEDRDSDDIDEYDDEIAFDQAHQKNENNLFKSASDAVLSIVKKAAEVLVKTNTNRTTIESKSERGCFTPSAGDFICNQCKDTTLAAKVNYVLSCRHRQLIDLLGIDRLRDDILTSQICAKRFSVNLDSHLDCKSSSSGMDERNSYFLSLLPDDYVGALCQLLAGRENKSQNDTMDVGSDEEQNGEVSLNLTIDKGDGGAFGTLEKLPDIGEVQRKPKVDDDSKVELSAQIPPPPHKHAEDVITTTERIDTSLPVLEPLDINIYNLPELDDENSGKKEFPSVEIVTSEEIKIEESTGELTPSAKVEVELLPKASTVVNSAENDSSSWDNLDTLLAEGVGTGTATALGGNNHGNQHKLPSGPHSESVFIRLNNRIKALERNMSLSGQYLEELSRRYKKQVEELQLSLTKTVRTLEEQNYRYSEQERVLLERNALLKDELDEVSLQVHACIVLIIFVGSFMILLTVLGVVFYRSIARNHSSNSNKQTEKRKTSQKKLNRRKSFDDFSDASTGKQKVRRPSEEAMLILKDCVAENSAPESEVSNTKMRQRKISVFYGRKANRKGEKRSWPEVTQPGEFNPGVEDLPPAEPVPVLEDEEYDKFNASESDSICMSDLPPSNIKSSSSRKLSNLFNGKGRKNSKKNNPAYKRQESAPADICNTTANSTDTTFDEKVILDEDDIENFIPGADLAYNEFMPDGPSGYQISDVAKPEETRKKSRRLSSPAFFKSPFSKSKKSPPHEPTSWEWYRSKKSSSTSTTSSQHQQNGENKLPSSKVNGFSSTVHGQPSPASSLSEILPNSGQGSSDNSFRILEEAINTSTIATSSSSNGNSGSGSNSGSSAGSNRSSKKNRSFNKLFKKVF